jgi:3-phenylpropionate/cinnamic acid dioxygenase small subunit
MDDQRAPGEKAADEWAVRNTIAKVALYADGLGSIDEYAALFTEDAQQLMPGAPRSGREDIRAGSAERRAAGGVGPGSNSRHMISTLAVEFTGPDEAVADSYFTYFVETNEAPRVQLVGHYHDTLRRTPEGWLMARREITLG